MGSGCPLGLSPSYPCIIQLDLSHSKSLGEEQLRASQSLGEPGTEWGWGVEGMEGGEAGGRKDTVNQHGGQCPGAQPDTELALSISQRSLPGLVSFPDMPAGWPCLCPLSDHLFLTFKAKSRKDQMSCLFGS